MIHVGGFDELGKPAELKVRRYWVMCVWAKLPEIKLDDDDIDEYGNASVGFDRGVSCRFEALKGMVRKAEKQADVRDIVLLKVKVNEGICYTALLTLLTTVSDLATYWLN